MANNVPAFAFKSPVGRLVQGDVFEGQKTDKDGKPYIVKTGPNAGQPTTKYMVAVAIEKTNPDLPAFWALLQEAARAGYPAMFNAQGQCTHPRFTFKMMDGDGTDANGKSNAEKPGFKGCYVFKFSSNFPPKAVHNGQYINDPQAIKRGYYVQVAGNAQANVGSDVPGLYLNQEAVLLVGYGEEIRGGIDAIGVFAQGNQSGYVPAGMTTTPPAPTNPGLPALAGPGAAAGMQMPGAGLALPGAAAPTAGPGLTLPGAAAALPTPGLSLPAAGPAPMAGMQMPGAAALPTPNPAFVQNAITPPAPAAPAALQITAAGQAAGYTLEQWRAAGKTDAELIGAGYFTAPSAAVPAAGLQMPGMSLPSLAPQPRQLQITPAGQAAGYTLEQWRAAGKTDAELIGAGYFA